MQIKPFGIVYRATNEVDESTHQRLNYIFLRDYRYSILGVSRERFSG